MSYDVIHILLFDSKVLNVELKNVKSNILFKHLWLYLNIKSNETLGLLYKDSRGVEQWLDESKLISEHDIVPHEKIIQFTLMIRFIPHHVCEDENNIHQMILLARRLLRQNWFITQPEIHSQLVALNILSLYGINLSDSEVHSSISRCNLSMVDPISKDNYFDNILSAYKVYRDKFDSVADFSLKFLQLMMEFPIFNSRLFVISNCKGEKFIMGVNSVQITIFNLDQYHKTLNKIDLKNVNQVMHRDLKIIIRLKDCQRNQQSIFLNELITYFALSTHQSDCLYQEIESCWDKSKTAPLPSRINQLMKDETFKNILQLSMKDNVENYRDYHSKFVNLHIILSNEKGQISNEREFGEVSMYESDIYKKLEQVQNNKTDFVYKPKPDFEQLSSEVETLKSILNEKMSQLVENCKTEKELTGYMPIEYNLYFITVNPRFIRNNNLLPMGHKSHKAAKIKKKVISNTPLAHSRILSKDDLSYHSSKNGKEPNSLSIDMTPIKKFQSVTDLRLINSSKFYEECDTVTLKSSERPSISSCPSEYSYRTAMKYSGSHSNLSLISESPQRNNELSSNKYKKATKKSLKEETAFKLLH